MHGLEVVLLEASVQADALADRADREDGQRRDAVVLVAVGNPGGMTFRTPRPPASRNEQKTAFIKEGQMGPKFARLFLYAATCIASNARWLVRPAARADVREPGRTTAVAATPARRGWGDSGRRTPGGSPGRCVSASTARWGSRRPSLPSAAGPAASGIRPSEASAADQGLVWPPRPPVRLRPRFDTTARRRRWKFRLDATPLPSSDRCPAVASPVAVAAPVSWRIHGVSCTIDRRFSYITFAKLNSPAEMEEIDRTRRETEDTRCLFSASNRVLEAENAGFARRDRPPQSPRRPQMAFFA